MSLAAVTARARGLLRDTGRPFTAQVTGDGVTARFDVPYEPISPEVSVAIDGVLVLPADYSVDAAHGVVTLNTPPSSGSAVAVAGTYFEDYTDDQLQVFVDTSFALHTHGRTDDNGVPLTYDSLPPIEEYLVAVLAVIESLWAEATEASKEIDVTTPSGVTILQTERYRQILEMLDRWEAEYERLSNALGVGLYHLQMFTLRRVSRLTNRLVPVYKPQEYDDSGWHEFAPVTGPVGSTVSIFGTNFTGATAVKFGSVLATSFTVVNDTLITAVVPVGATTGPITVMTLGGSVVSTKSFTVAVPAPAFRAPGPVRVFPTVDPGVL